MNSRTDTKQKAMAMSHSLLEGSTKFIKYVCDTCIWDMFVDRRNKLAEFCGDGDNKWIAHTSNVAKIKVTGIIGQ